MRNDPRPFDDCSRFLSCVVYSRIYINIMLHDPTTFTSNSKSTFEREKKRDFLFGGRKEAVLKQKNRVLREAGNFVRNEKRRKKSYIYIYIYIADEQSAELKNAM